MKTLRPLLKITNKRIMKYVSTFTIFTMVFGVVFWSLQFYNVNALEVTIFSENFDQSGDDLTNKWKAALGAENPDSSGDSHDARESLSDNSWGGVEVSGNGLLLEGSSSSDPDEGAERDISTHGYAILKVKYSRALNDFESGDSFVAEYSLDGEPAVILETLTSDIAHSNVSNPVEFTISNTDRHTKLTLRFKINGNEGDDEVGIDNLQVNGDNAPGFYDGFESGNFITGGWDEDDDAEVRNEDDIDIWTDDNDFSEGYAVELEGETSLDPDERITKSFSTVGLENIYVRYSRETEVTPGTDPDDYFKASYFIGGDINDEDDWINLEPTITTDQSYATVLVNLPDSVDNNANFKIRFAMFSDDSSDEAYIDDVVIWGDPMSTGSISGYKFNDLNGDGDWDTEDESGLSGWTITLSNGDEAVTDGSGYYTFDELENDEYTVCEVVLEDDEPWTQTKPSSGTECVDDTNGYSVEISDGDQLTGYNFGNVQYGSIIVKKEINDIFGDDQEFNFKLAQGESIIGTTSLSGGEEDSFNNLLSGTYTITEESIPEDWDLESVYCEYDDEEVGVSVENGEQVTLDAGDVVTCTFTNTKLSTFSFEKVANPNEGSFDFTLSGPDDFSQSVTLGPDADEEEWELENLTPGEYTLTETLPENWQGGSQTLLCNSNDEDGDIEQDLSQTGSAMTFDLSVGESLSCTLNNTEDTLISGIKFEDSDGTGDSTTGTGLSGWTITATKVLEGDLGGGDNLDDGDENGGEPQSFSDTTDQDGNYSIQVPAGTWTVCEAQQGEPWSQSYPVESVENSTPCDDGQGYEVTVVAGGGKTGLDFGNYQNGSISGYKWEDTNADGIFDEDVLDGWTIFLDLDDDGVFDDEDEPYQETGDEEEGFYYFGNLVPGTYVVREVLKGGWTQIFPGADTSFKHTVVVMSGEEEENWNFGNFKLVTITGFKWNDKNGDGVWQQQCEENNEGCVVEPGLPDVIVALGRIDVNREPRQENGHEVVPIEIIALQLTSSNPITLGQYQFNNVSRGHYKLFEEKKNGWQATSPASRVDSFFDITYDLGSIAIGDPDFDLLRIGDPDFDLLRPSFFDVFVEFSGQNVNQSQEIHTVLTTIPSVPLEFGNHQLSVISEENAAGVGEASVTIRWNTDRLATSRVLYDTVSHPVLGSGLCPSPLETLECYGYAFSTPESDLAPKVLAHNVVINGLTVGTTYYYRTVSAASPESVGSEGSFNTQSPPSNNGGGGGGGGAPGGIIINGPGATPTPTSTPSTGSTSSPQAGSGQATPTPPTTSVPLFVAGAITGDGSGVGGSSTTPTADFEGESLEESDQTSSSPSVTPEVSEEDQEVSDNNLFASFANLFGSVSWGWLLVFVVVILAVVYINKRKNKDR